MGMCDWNEASVEKGAPVNRSATAGNQDTVWMLESGFFRHSPFFFEDSSRIQIWRRTDESCQRGYVAAFDPIQPLERVMDREGRNPVIHVRHIQNRQWN